MDARHKTLKFSRWEVGIDPNGIAPVERDLNVLQFIFENGPTRTGIIHALFWPGVAKQNAYRRLMRMNRRPHRYVYKPSEQKLRADANYTDLIYDITQQGIDLLLAYKRITPQQVGWYRTLRGRGRYLNFWHQVLGAEVMGSIRIGLSATPNIRFVSLFEILETAPEKTKTHRKNPLTIDLQNGETLTPDGFFGLEYISGADSGYFYFAREDDLTNEPVRRLTSSGSSYYQKLLKYRVALENGLLNAHFGKKAPIIVMNAMTSERHMQTTMQHAATLKGDWLGYLLFQYERSFGLFERPKKPNDRFLSVPYKRVGNPDFSIKTP